MNYYILDDDINIVLMLRDIVEDSFKRAVIGFSSDAVTAEKEILELRPDIVLVDYLMPEMHGAELVKKIKRKYDGARFVMISQVDDKSMLSESYFAGIDYFIRKPINKTEVTEVLSRLERQIDMENTLNAIKGLINSPVQNKQVESRKDERMDKVRNALHILGIVGEIGSSDVIGILTHYYDAKGLDIEAATEIYCNLEVISRKAVYQRIRRAATKGLQNLASLGTEDFDSVVFQNYSHLIYDFESVKDEMDYKRGRKFTGGSVNAKKFLMNIAYYGEKS